MADSDPITIKIPSKYAPKSAPPPADGTAAAPPTPAVPTQEWLVNTWPVTHSTFPKWRSARNVRITYTRHPAISNRGFQQMDDLVEYEPTAKTGVLKNIVGLDSQAADGSFQWRGKGLLMFMSSHWEILAWGEDTTEDGQAEKWMVIWFASTLVSKEGLDILCSRKEGLSEATYNKIQDALKNSGGPQVAALNQSMQPVAIKLPWVEK